MAYTQFGARLARLGRFDSCTLYQIFAPVVQRIRMVGLHPTDAGSTPERRTRACPEQVSEANVSNGQD